MFLGRVDVKRTAGTARSTSAGLCVQRWVVGTWEKALGGAVSYQCNDPSEAMPNGTAEAFEMP